ncbi:nucleotide exchange factor GrpE [Aquimarina agarilytica]|uniref:nucleotide exchange factor GrpE n=1 Tax=Aquimarina agarilytica TaxID=1087449 RepID=UPI000289B618|nr:nucleotide exchange factor GrpE [Aquimarina agarilytica]
MSTKDKAKETVDEIIQDSTKDAKVEEKETQPVEEKDELTLAKEAAAVEKDKFLRLFAEFENYKKRTSKERVELFKTAGQEVLQALLPVLDDFDRASKEIEKSEDEALKQGVTLIHNKLKDILKLKGLEQVEVNTADTFDADIHEAITQIPAPSDDLKGKIIDVVEKGYKLGDKIIRYPKVVTGN